MRILTGNNHLQKTGGTENFTFALSVELKRLGHEVEYFTFEKGEISDKLEDAGIPFMSHNEYDLILVNHNTVVEYLWPYGYIIQTCHGTVPDLEQPSPFADRFVCVTEEVRIHLQNKGLKADVILNGIDCNRFAPHVTIHSQLTSVLSLSQSDELNTFIKSCCENIGVSFMSCNKFTDNVWEIENDINKADLVVGIGRSLYDAMACGRCIISYDNRSYVNGSIGDGYITSDNIEKSIWYNCSGRGLHKTFTKEEFIAELKKYNPSDGQWAREYALEHLNVAITVQHYLSLYSLHEQTEEDSLYLRGKKSLMRLEKEKIMKKEVGLYEKYNKAKEANVNLTEQNRQLHEQIQASDRQIQWLARKNKKHLRQVRLLGFSGIVLIIAIIILLFN